MASVAINYYVMSKPTGTYSRYNHSAKCGIRSIRYKWSSGNRKKSHKHS